MNNETNLGRKTLSQIFNVLVGAEFRNISEESRKDIYERLTEHGFEKIPTIEAAWEMRCEAEDETDAKDKAIQGFINVSRTYPFELGLVVQCGTSQILRRKKKFDP